VTIRRRLAIKILSVLLICGLIVPVVSASDTNAPPNILIMVADDQRWDEMGVVQVEQGDKARFPFLQTPRLDALAAQGMRFRNAFVTTSLCSPSRSAILTGQYNHTNGVTNNTTPFLPRPTWATALQAEGYTTAMVGKWHHERQLERPGFDYVATYPAQGKYNDSTFIVNDEIIETRGYVDERTVDFAIDFLQGQGDKPFAMLVGFKAVHKPFTPMPEHAGNYASDTIGPAENWNADAPWKVLRKPKRIRKQFIPQYWKDILRTLDGLDLNVGRLLDALERLNLANNTLVIYTSDNGFYLGEHGLGDKRSAYEESMRVPLIVRLPGVIPPGTVSDAMVLNIDFAPTILDLALQDVPAQMQGLSMRPLFSENPPSWRKAFLYEYWQEDEWGIGSSKPAMPTILAVRTESHKLITYPGHTAWTELFDLRADAYEIRNLVGTGASQDKMLSSMCALLQQMLAETDYIARPSVDLWLSDFIGPRSNDPVYVRETAPVRRPPMMHPNC
jgi:N-acetylglucosamine-6-sulfatase